MCVCVNGTLPYGQVDGGSYMSIAKLTKEPLSEMVSVVTAPRIFATVLNRQADFNNVPGLDFDGQPVIPQV